MHTSQNRFAPAAFLLLACSLAWLGGCAGSTAAPRIAMVSPAQGRTAVVVDADGRRVEWNRLVAAASEAEVVIIGENHGHPMGLAAAAALWEDVLARSPRAALAMEFIERDEQSRVDDYLTGVIDEPTFRKRTNRSEGNYPAGHRAMVEAAKAAKRPVIAANAPRAYVRLARMEGYERLASLTPEQKRLVRVPDDVIPRGARYRDDFDRVMGGATSPEQTAQLDATFRSQQVWDWTMAESAARAVDGGNAPVALVVGRFHCDFDGGLPQALRRLRPGTKALVVSFVDESAPATGMREDDKGRAGFVVYVGNVPG